jgi:hypothetical protein
MIGLLCLPDCTDRNDRVETTTLCLSNDFTVILVYKQYFEGIRGSRDSACLVDERECVTGGDSIV